MNIKASCYDELRWRILKVLVINSSNKKGYIGMGGFTGKGGVTSYIITFVGYILARLKSNNVGCNLSLSCDPTFSYLRFFIQKIVLSNTCFLTFCFPAPSFSKKDLYELKW